MNLNASIARFVSRAGRGIRVLLPGLFFVCALCAARSQEVAQSAFSLEEFRDPRGIGCPALWIENGEENRKDSPIKHSILIIAWHPAPGEIPDGSVVYQIGGLEGYHSQELVEHFLREFYQLDHQPDGPPNVIVAGNNWGAGLGLRETLIELSKARSFSVFYSGGYAFRKALLLPELAPRLKLIQEAYAQISANDSEKR